MQTAFWTAFVMETRVCLVPKLLFCLQGLCHYQVVIPNGLLLSCAASVAGNGSY